MSTDSLSDRVQRKIQDKKGSASASFFENGALERAFALAHKHDDIKPDPYILPLRAMTHLTTGPTKKAN